MTILFWLAAAAFAYLAWRKLPWALMLLLFLLPSYLWRASIFGLPTTFLELMIWSVFASWFSGQYRQLLANIKAKLAKKPQSQSYPFAWELIIWLILALVAVAVAGFSSSALGAFKAYFFEPAMLFLVVFNVFGPDKRWSWALWPLFWSSLAVSLVSWYQEFVDISLWNPVFGLAQEPRTVSIFPYPNASGLFLAPISAMILARWTACWPLARRGDEKAKAELMLLSAILIFNVGALVFARSEGALFGLAAATVLLLLWSGRASRWALAALVAVMALAMYWAPLRNFAWEKLTLRDLSGEIRKQQWRETWQLLSERWLFGAGLANYQEAVAPYHQPGIFFNKDKDPLFRRKLVFGEDQYKKDHWQPVEVYEYPHSLLLNFWSELGLLGMLLFVWLAGKYLTISLRLAKVSQSQSDWLALGLAMMLVAQLAHGLVDVPYFKNDLSAMFWLQVALLGILMVSRPVKAKK